jgi:alpha-L-arabinofuranosidase
MRLIPVSTVIALLAVVSSSQADESSNTDVAAIRISIDANNVGPPINPFIYGQFIEHLGRCIYGGIWAEMLEDRKFYFPITDKYDPYRSLKDTKFPVVGASPWQVIGPPGSVRMSKDKPFVGEHTPLIAPGSGIRQNDLGIEFGKAYNGYVRAKAAEGNEAKVVIHFSWSRKSVEFKVTNEFRKYEFSFRADRANENGSIEIENDSKVPVLIGAASLMPAVNVRGMRADTLALLRQLHGTIYRWPGGNFVSGYDWRDGIGPRDRRPPRKNPAWTGVEHNDFGLDEFLDFCHESDADPMIAVNTGFGDDYSAAQEVEYTNCTKDTIGGSWRVENGHFKTYAVKHWCVGNEMWGPWQLGYMQLGQYTQKHNRVADAMRKVDPNIVLVASGDLGTKGVLDGRKKRHEVGWSEGMIEQCFRSMDFISEHFYANKRQDETAAHVAQIVDAIRAKADGHRRMQVRLREREPEINKLVPIVMDEWNYWHQPYKYGELGCEYQLRDALGIAAGLHEYFRNSDIIQMANYAQTVNVIGCIKTTKTAAFFDTTALPLLLYRREFGTLPLTVTGNHGQRALDVAAAKTKDGRAMTIAIVNPQANPQAINIRIDGAKLDHRSTLWRIAGDDPTATNTADTQAVAIEEQKNVPFGNQLKVPAYSVNLYRVSIRQ